MSWEQDAWWDDVYSFMSGELGVNGSQKSILWCKLTVSSKFREKMLSRVSCSSEYVYQDACRKLKVESKLKVDCKFYIWSWWSDSSSEMRPDQEWAVSCDLRVSCQLRVIDASWDGVERTL